jgi:hypothetical protein
MTRFEMFGAVRRDMELGEYREFAPESGVFPNALEEARYDRRGLLNVVDALLDELDAAYLAPDAGLRAAAQRLCDAIADEAAVMGLARSGLPQGWRAEMDASDARLCALQDTRTALDGRERPHNHRAALAQPAEPEAGTDE